MSHGFPIAIATLFTTLSMLSLSRCLLMFRNHRHGRTVAIFFLWLLAASFGWADENSSRHYRTRKSAEKSRHTTSDRLQKHSIQRSDSEDNGTPSPASKKGSNEETSKESGSEPSPSPAPAIVA